MRHPGKMHFKSLGRFPFCRLGCACLVLILFSIFCSACSSTKLLMTKSVNFRCDSNFNDGFILPVDIVYISKGEKIDTITGISPDEWFDSPVREEWPHLQSLSFRESDLRATTKIELKKTKQTIAMVIIADYRGLDKQKAQMIIFDANSKEHEDIFITINGLLH
jgi:hypothetical protein